MFDIGLLHIFFLSILFIVVFLLGFLFGLILSNRIVFQHDYRNNKPKSFFDKNEAGSTSTSPSIDSTKFVVNIKTDGMEKKYDSLGETKVSSENISNSISKLKNMKQ